MSQRTSSIAQRAQRPIFECFEKARECHFQGRLAQAEQSYRDVLQADERHFGSIHGLGLIYLQQGRFAEAMPLFRRAVKIDKSSAEAHHHLAVALTGVGRTEEAIERFARALAIRLDFAEAHDSLGHALQMLGRNEAAISHHESALAIKPGYAEAHNNLGNALHRLGRPEKAIAHYEQALALRASYPEAHNNLGLTLAALGRHEGAIAQYERAIAIRPDYLDAHINLGNALGALGRGEEAIARYRRALEIRPDHVEALLKLGYALLTLKREGEALASFERAISIEPGNPYVLSGLAHCALTTCDWTSMEKLSRELPARVAKGKLTITPLDFLACCGDPSLQFACAKTFISHEVPVSPPRLCRGTIWRNEKIRIAYVSAGFHEHPNGYMTAELFELHDRSRFDVLGISLGPDDRSEIRARLIRGFDEFHDVRSVSDHDVAAFLCDKRVDIAVDRSGYMTAARPTIFAHRPAPIQVNYMGFPGTLGSDFYDYVIADRTVLPLNQQAFYAEKIVRLPDCYQCNDSKRVIAPETISRVDAGLPTQGFVFCCFNNNYKINASLFDIWMHLLARIEESVLWLFASNSTSETNLRGEAALRGIDPARLVFAGRVKLAEHLARHRLADLFLDTLPFNAHTTGSDALWAGLPLITCAGEAFAGRVAASMLKAIGLPELAAGSLEEYERLALRLATDACLLQSFRERLKQNRLVYPLFDTDRYRHHIEAAYIKMWETWQRGESPRSFAVEPLPTVPAALGEPEARG